MDTEPTTLRTFGTDTTPRLGAEADGPLIVDADREQTISHRYGITQIGFDGATFASAESFADLLDEHDLPREPVVVDTTNRDRRDPFTRGAFVWVNDRVLLVSLYNPLTGGVVDDYRTGEPGDAHYLGLEGDRQPTRELARGIARRAHYQARDLEGRSFI